VVSSFLDFLSILSALASISLQSGVEVPYRAIKTNIADSLNVVLQIERRPGNCIGGFGDSRI
jgi:hypothetical protein